MSAVIQGGTRRIARQIGVSRNTASRWNRSLSGNGVESLRKRRAPGRPSRLTAEQLLILTATYQAGPRAAGFEMRVTLEAVVGFVSRSQSSALAKVAAPARVVQPKRSLEVTANDRRFLRSLRIAADETAEPVE